jgi:hypothetical protein
MFNQWRVLPADDLDLLLHRKTRPRSRLTHGMIVRKGYANPSGQSFQFQERQDSHWGLGGKRVTLRFSTSGDQQREVAYSRHYLA